MRCLAALLLLALAAPAAHAACYDPQEMEAEKAVRLHSRLMVIALSCQHTDAGVPIMPAYDRFTQRHVHALKHWEGALINFFRRTGQGKTPERALDTLRTRLANETTQEAMQSGLSTFCARMAPQVLLAASLSEPQLKADLAQWPNVGTHPACASGGGQ